MLSPWWIVERWLRIPTVPIAVIIGNNHLEKTVKTNQIVKSTPTSFMCATVDTDTDYYIEWDESTNAQVERNIHAKKPGYGIFDRISQEQ